MIDRMACSLLNVLNMLCIVVAVVAADTVDAAYCIVNMPYVLICVCNYCFPSSPTPDLRTSLWCCALVFLFGDALASRKSQDDARERLQVKKKKKIVANTCQRQVEKLAHKKE